VRDERRKHPRIASAWLVSYADYDQERVLKSLGVGKTVDVSEGGVQVICSEAFHVPTELELDLALGDDLLRVKGRVVYAQEVAPGKYSMGIRFLDLPPAATEKLREFVAKKLAKRRFATPS